MGKKRNTCYCNIEIQLWTKPEGVIVSNNWSGIECLKIMWRGHIESHSPCKDSRIVYIYLIFNIKIYLYKKNLSYFNLLKIVTLTQTIDTTAAFCAALGRRKPEKWQRPWAFLSSVKVHKTVWGKAVPTCLALWFSQGENSDWSVIPQVALLDFLEDGYDMHILQVLGILSLSS